MFGSGKPAVSPALQTTRRLPLWRRGDSTELACLRAECQQLRWERDHLANQVSGAEAMWQQLAVLAAECDELRQELARTRAARPGSTGPGSVVSRATPRGDSVDDPLGSALDDLLGFALDGSPALAAA